MVASIHKPRVGRTRLYPTDAFFVIRVWDTDGHRIKLAKSKKRTKALRAAKQIWLLNQSNTVRVYVETALYAPELDAEFMPGFQRVKKNGSWQIETIDRHPDHRVRLPEGGNRVSE